jgi:hypothetical protein
MRHGASLPVYAFDRALETKIASGKLLTLDNQIDTATGTVKARAIFDNQDEALFPNQFVNTKFQGILASADGTGLQLRSRTASDKRDAAAAKRFFSQSISLFLQSHAARHQCR